MWALRARHLHSSVVRPSIRRLTTRPPIQPGETKAAEQAAADAVGGGAFGWFRRLLIERPLVTNSLTAAGLGVAGDAAAQYAEFFFDITSPGKSSYNWNRSINMAVFGAIAGPIYSGWYRALDRAAKSSTFGMSYDPQIVFKVIADNVFASPFMLHLYYGVTGVLEGREMMDIVDNARTSFYRAWGLGLSVWMPAQFFNFHMMPVWAQPVFVASVDTAWKMSLSLLNHKAAYGKQPDRAPGEMGPAAPALSFEWPTPSQKLAACQTEIAKQVLQIDELTKENARLTQKVAEQEKLMEKLIAKLP